MLDVPSGSIIAGRFRVERTLGRGAFGTVYLAQAPGGSPVALKVMHELLTETSDAVQRFRREAELVRQLRHPNVVRLVDVGQSEAGAPFIAFELLHGRTLRQELARRTLPLAECVAVARQVLAALAAAHAVGVIHRDIKPENIFLCDAPPAGAPTTPAAPSTPGVHIKVLDFGIAKLADRDRGTALTETGQMLGTPQYMPPEQVRGTAVDARSDLYALGLVMAEAVTGRRLVDGASQIDIFMSQISEDALEIPEPLRSSALGAVVARAVAKRPEDRFSSAAAMAAALAPAGARTPSWPPAKLPEAQFAGVDRTVELRASEPPRSSDEPPTALLSLSLAPSLAPSQPPSTRAWTRPLPTIPSYPPPPPPRRATPPRRVVWALAGLLAALLVGIGIGIFVSGEPPHEERRASASAGSDSKPARARRKQAVRPGVRGVPREPVRLDGLDPAMLKARLVRDGFEVVSLATQEHQTLTATLYAVIRNGRRANLTLVQLQSEAVAEVYRKISVGPHVAHKVEGLTSLTVQTAEEDPAKILEGVLVE